MAAVARSRWHLLEKEHGQQGEQEERGHMEVWGGLERAGAVSTCRHPHTVNRGGGLMLEKELESGTSGLGGGNNQGWSVERSGLSGGTRDPSSEEKHALAPLNS